MKENRNPTSHNSTTTIPPDIEIVKIYFSQRGKSDADAISFYKVYKTRKWKTIRGCPVKNWMTAANNWIWNHRPKRPITIARKLTIEVRSN